MVADDASYEILGGRALVVPGVRKGVLRMPGTLLLTRRRLAFVPGGETGDGLLEALRGGAAAGGDGGGGGDPVLAALIELVALAERDDEGILLPRRHPLLAPPDADGRIRLLRLGEEDDLLVPVGAVDAVSLLIGEPQAAGDPIAAWLDPGRGVASTAGAGAATGGPEGGGRIGPIAAGSGAVLTLLALPVLVFLSVLAVDQIEDELGALLFLLGSAALALGHLATFGGAAWSFARREPNRWWGLSALLFALITGVVVLAGSLLALDELF